MTLGHIQSGTGSKRVIILHEWLGNHTNYDSVLPFLDRSTFSVALPDLRGYGLSRDRTGKYNAEEAAADVLALATSLQWDEFHLVAHSMSAMVAHKIARVAPHRLRSLVAITPAPPLGFCLSPDIVESLRSILANDEAAANAIVARTSHRYGSGWLKGKIALARAAGAPEAMHGYLAMFCGREIESSADILKTPVLAITGRHDLDIYREGPVSARLMPLYSNLSTVVAPESGHYPMLEQPVFLASKIEEFVRHFER